MADWPAHGTKPWDTPLREYIDEEAVFHSLPEAVWPLMGPCIRLPVGAPVPAGLPDPTFIFRYTP